MRDASSAAGASRNKVGTAEDETRKKRPITAPRPEDAHTRVLRRANEIAQLNEYSIKEGSLGQRRHLSSAKASDVAKKRLSQPGAFAQEWLRERATRPLGVPPPWVAEELAPIAAKSAALKTYNQHAYKAELPPTTARQLSALATSRSSTRGASRRSALTARDADSRMPSAGGAGLVHCDSRQSRPKTSGLKDKRLYSKASDVLLSQPPSPPATAWSGRRLKSVGQRVKADAVRNLFELTAEEVLRHKKALGDDPRFSDGTGCTEAMRDFMFPAPRRVAQHVGATVSRAILNAPSREGSDAIKGNP